MYERVDYTATGTDELHVTGTLLTAVSFPHSSVHLFLFKHPVIYSDPSFADYPKIHVLVRDMVTNYTKDAKDLVSEQYNITLCAVHHQGYNSNNSTMWPVSTVINELPPWKR